MQTRMVQCLVQGKPSPGCALHLKPPMSQACNTNFCPPSEKKGTRALADCANLMSRQKLTNIFLSLVFPQTYRVGITSAGVTWCPSTESATTSSTASSAASPAQIPTCNSVCRRQQKTILDVGALSLWRSLKTKGILMEVQGSCSGLAMLDIWIQEPGGDSTM